MSESPAVVLIGKDGGTLCIGRGVLLATGRHDVTDEFVSGRFNRRWRWYIRCGTNVHGTPLYNETLGGVA